MIKWVEAMIKEAIVHVWQHLRAETSGKEPAKAGYILLGLPALFPIICLIPDIIRANGSDLDSSLADVTGTGAELCLFITLMISPLILVTGNRWFQPLRKWYGIMTAIIAITDAIIASIVTVEFGSAPLGRLSDHIFLLAGLTMVIILTVVMVTSNNFSMKVLGKYWPKVQKLTYVVWFILGVHLALLFNLGPHSSGPIDHQRFYLYLACSIPLIIYRLPVVRKSILKLRRLGYQKFIYIMSIPWIAMFVVPMSFIINEEVYKGVNLFLGHAINN